MQTPFSGNMLMYVKGATVCEGHGYEALDVPVDKVDKEELRVQDAAEQETS